MTGQPSFNDDERKLFALPPYLGGLGIIDHQEHSTYQFSALTAITSPLVHLILQQSSIYTTEARLKQFKAKYHVVVSDHRQVIVMITNNNQESFKNPCCRLSQKSISLSVEMGSSSWLIALLLLEHGFVCIEELLRMLCVLGMAGNHLC